MAPVEESGLGKAVRVAGGEEESLFQPSWSPDGTLHFVSDRTGWWNLYRWQNGKAAALCPMEAEFGLPQWNFGSSTYCFNPNGEICVPISKKDSDSSRIWSDPQAASPQFPPLSPSSRF